MEDLAISAANQKVDKLEHRRHLDKTRDVNLRLNNLLGRLDNILEHLPDGAVGAADLAAFRVDRQHFVNAYGVAYTATGQPLLDQGHERVIIPADPPMPPAGAPGANIMFDNARGFYMNRQDGTVYRKQGPANTQEEKHILVLNENGTIDILSTLKELVSFGTERGYAHHHYRTYMKRMTTKIDKDLYDSIHDQTTAQELADMLCQYHWSTAAPVNIIAKVKSFARKKDESLSSAVQRYKVVLHAMLARTEPDQQKREWKEEQFIQDVLKSLVHPKLKSQVENKLQQKRDFRIDLNITDYVEVLSECEIENDLLPSRDIQIKQNSESLYNTEVGPQAKRPQSRATPPRGMSPIRESSSNPFDNLITGAKRKTYDSNVLPRQQSTSPRRIVTARRRTTPSPSGSQQYRQPQQPRQQYQQQSQPRQQYQQQPRYRTPSPQKAEMNRSRQQSPWRGHTVYKENPQFDGQQRQSRRDNWNSYGRNNSQNRDRNRSGSRYRSMSRERYTKNNMYTAGRDRSYSRRRLQSPGSYFLKIIPGLTVPYNYSHSQAANTCLKCASPHKTGNCLRYVIFTNSICSMCGQGLHREAECKQQRLFHMEATEEGEDQSQQKLKKKEKNCKMCL